MILWILFGIAAILLVLVSELRFFFTLDRRPALASGRHLAYAGLAAAPLLAFCLKACYLPAFHLLFLLSCLLQERVIPISTGHADRDVRVRFVTFCSLHLFLLGLTAVLTHLSLDRVLHSPQWVLGTVIGTAVLMGLCNLDPILHKEKTTLLVWAEQKQDIRFLYLFLNLATGYIFLQSILCQFGSGLSLQIAFYLCGNLISVALIHVYLRTLYFLKDISDREQANQALEHSIRQGDQQIRHLLTSIHFDGLTGARSRLFLIQESTRLLERQTPFTLVYLDLNGLKGINDTFGHQAGDAYLCRFVKMLQGQIRPEDTLARFGGDEFILLLPRCPRQTAESRMERILEYMCANRAALHFLDSFAAGCADTTEAAGLEELIALADQRMYVKKEEGRLAKHA